MIIFFERNILRFLRERLRTQIGETKEIDGMFWNDGELDRYINESINDILNRIRWWSGENFYARMRNTFELSDPEKLKYLTLLIETPPYLYSDNDYIDCPIVFSTTILNYAVYLAKKRDIKEDLILYEQNTEKGILKCRKFVETFINFGNRLKKPPAPEIRPSAPRVVVEGRVLSWSPSRQGTYPIIGYNVYRSIMSGTLNVFGPTTSGTFNRKLNAEVITTTTYRDTTVAVGIVYHYVVRAVDIFNQESDNSNEVRVQRVFRLIDDFNDGIINSRIWVIDPPLIVPYSPDPSISIVESDGRLRFSKMTAGAGIRKFVMHRQGNISFIPLTEDFEVEIDMFIEWKPLTGMEHGFFQYNFLNPSDTILRGVRFLRRSDGVREIGVVSLVNPGFATPELTFVYMPITMRTTYTASNRRLTYSYRAHDSIIYINIGFLEVPLGITNGNVIYKISFGAVNPERVLPSLDNQIGDVL